MNVDNRACNNAVLKHIRHLHHVNLIALMMMMMMMTSRFNGRAETLTPRISQTLNFSIPKFAQMITSGISPYVQNLVKICSLQIAIVVINHFLCLLAKSDAFNFSACFIDLISSLICLRN